MCLSETEKGSLSAHETQYLNYKNHMGSSDNHDRAFVLSFKAGIVVKNLPPVYSSTLETPKVLYLKKKFQFGVRHHGNFDELNYLSERRLKTETYALDFSIIALFHCFKMLNKHLKNII